ncbi:MAG: hypothetical protein R2852_02375 [Bacteroidia bacterium]
MKIIKNPNLNSNENSNSLILLCYWFISSKHNQSLFSCLKELQKNFGKELLQIVCLNPFNSTEDINQYKERRQLPFQMETDTKNTNLFYHINTFPSCLLMEASGKILLRKNGFDEEGLSDIDAFLKTNYTPLLEIPNRVSDDLHIRVYKDNLFGQVHIV